ncbi:hypothetical protein [Swaminathania salitolerans]|uniref:Rod shape-determining protein MreD n=1 Tax=Swaminathania salitolerans TaxID=182838 RepID=A0A511BS76_9PROT|nr:hypothetical protein [Swaminathania salitolerans]GBQ12849.1 rod shape-determining protein MreD [Swaminathania salitolerans LMG 21291]GEL03187.1 hypothetical protein SSA02_23500 [Swaminathania salitolerans]
MVTHRLNPEIHPGIAPRPTLRRRLDMAMRALMPSLFVVVSMVILSADLGLPGQAELSFALATGTVFFWSAHRPASMTAVMTFCIGLIGELLGFGPPGVLLFSLLVMHGVAHLWRYGLSRISFLFAWALLGALSLVLSLFGWAIACIGSLTFLSPVPSLFQMAVTIGVYPTLSALFSWARRTVADPEQA